MPASSTKNVQTGVKTIRSLERGLHVLKILEDLSPASLKQIHQSSGLPRPTLLRILRTLESARLVRRGTGDGLYRNSFRLQNMVSKLDDGDRLAECAAPVLNQLCAKFSWPVDLAVVNPDGPYMELRETSRPNSPFLINLDQIGFQVNIPLSAAGRAYLAFCGDEERVDLLARVRESDDPQHKSAWDRPTFGEILRTVRRQGYAIRDPSFGGGQRALRSLYDDGLQAIAVPVNTAEKTHGIIALQWIRKAAKVDQMVKEYLGDLQAAAREIAAQYHRLV